MAPQRPSPISIQFTKTPFLSSFFSKHGPNFETDGRPDLGSRVRARRSWVRSPDLGSRAGPGLAPPPAGRGRSSSRRCIQARRRALQERRRGRRPPPAVPRRPSPYRPPRLSSPPSAPWRRVGSPCRWGRSIPGPARHRDQF
jgi:hypothetical protein